MQCSGCAGLFPHFSTTGVTAASSCCCGSSERSALCRWLCSTTAMEQDEMQPGSLLPAQSPPSLAHCCQVSPSQFLSQCTNQPRRAGFSDAALFIPGWTHTSNLFRKSQQPWQSRPPSGVSIFAAFSSGGEVTTNLGKGEPKSIWISPFLATTRVSSQHVWPQSLAAGFLGHSGKFLGFIYPVSTSLELSGQSTPNQVQDEAQDMGKCKCQ